MNLFQPLDYLSDKNITFSSDHVCVCLICVIFEISKTTNYNFRAQFILDFGSTCATRCKFLGALPKF